jgi:hypothetical protein
MTTADGTVLGTTVIVDHGNPSEHWNVVVMGDGYKVNELTKYHSDVDNFISKLSGTKPFDELWKAINIYRIDVSSTDSGADDPVACGGTGATPATYFDASFCGNGQLQRWLVVNRDTAIQVSTDSVPAWDVILVLVNSSIWGGTGGSGIAITPTHPAAAKIAIHEIGHAAFGLADEYDYEEGCESGETGHDRYNGPEPVESNITINTNRATIKWRLLIDPTTPLPTTSNSDCTKCDSQPSPVPEGTVGAFEGARYFHCGIYRPEFNCKMRDLFQEAFCAVCQETIIRGLSHYLFTIVPSVIGMDHRDARQAIYHQELIPRFSGPLTNSEVESQTPDGGDVVEKGSTVRITMVHV